MNPLRFSAGERARLALQGEIAKPDFDEVPSAISEFAQHYLGAFVRAPGELQRVQPFGEIAHRHASDVGNRLAIDEHVECFGVELRTLANRARNEAPVLGQQDSDVGLVAAPLKPFEEAVHSRPFVGVPLVARAFIAVEQPLALFIVHLAERDRRADLAAARQLEHPVVHLAIRRRSPGRDQPLAQRQVRIWNYLSQVELDRTPETFAFGAGANRAVRGEQSGSRLGIGNLASRAVEAAVEVAGLRGFEIAVFAIDADVAGAASAQVEGFLQRLADPLGVRQAVNRDAIDYHDHRTRHAASAIGKLYRLDD